ncbi:MAG TPA: hypothetical protein VNH84_12475 [Candidatus Saccharimonadales bacterium]|nr:hypothetical protein [Candidatus Saccharimonadales bacterium]
MNATVAPNETMPLDGSAQLPCRGIRSIRPTQTLQTQELLELIHVNLFKRQPVPGLRRDSLQLEATVGILRVVVIILQNFAIRENLQSPRREARLSNLKVRDHFTP